MYVLLSFAMVFASNVEEMRLYMLFHSAATPDVLQTSRLLFLIMQQQNDPQQTYSAGFGLLTKEKSYLCSMNITSNLVPLEVLYSLM